MTFEQSATDTKRLPTSRWRGFGANFDDIAYPEPIVQFVQQLSPAVVNFGTGGSGSIVTSDGVVATDDHVAKGHNDDFIVTGDGKTYYVKLQAEDPAHDLALYKIRSEFSNQVFPVLSLLDQKNKSLTEGTPVMGLGYPYPESMQTNQMFVSVGTFKEKSSLPFLPFLFTYFDRIKQEYGRPVLQYKMHVANGVSGGPIVDANGNMAGIVIAGDLTNKFTDATQVNDLINLLKENNMLERAHIVPANKDISKVNLSAVDLKDTEDYKYQSQIVLHDGSMFWPRVIVYAANTIGKLNFLADRIGSFNHVLSATSGITAAYDSVADFHNFRCDLQYRNVNASLIDGFNLVADAGVIAGGILSAMPKSQLRTGGRLLSYFGSLTKVALAPSS